MALQRGKTYNQRQIRWQGFERNYTIQPANWESRRVLLCICRKSHCVCAGRVHSVEYFFACAIADCWQFVWCLVRTLSYRLLFEFYRWIRIYYIYSLHLHRFIWQMCFYYSTECSSTLVYWGRWISACKSVCEWPWDANLPHLFLSLSLSVYCSSSTGWWTTVATAALRHCWTGKDNPTAFLHSNTAAFAVSNNSDCSAFSDRSVVLNDSLRQHLNVCAPSLSGAEVFVKGVQCFKFRYFRAVKATKKMFHMHTDCSILSHWSWTDPVIRLSLRKKRYITGILRYRR